jgi:hypothetical protein
VEGSLLAQRILQVCIALVLLLQGVDVGNTGSSLLAVLLDALEGGAGVALGI